MRHFCGGVASASEPLADTLSSKGVIQAKDENGDIAARFDAEDLKKVAELADDNEEKAEDLSSKASSLENQLGGVSFGLDENGKPKFSFKDESGAEVVVPFSKNPDGSISVSAVSRVEWASGNQDQSICVTFTIRVVDGQFVVTSSVSKSGDGYYQVYSKGNTYVDYRMHT